MPFSFAIFSYLLYNVNEDVKSMSKKEPVSAVSLVISLVALVVGILLCFYGETIYKIIGYGVSGVLILTGAVKFIAYLTSKSGNFTFSDCISSILYIGFGILIFCFPTAIPTTISIVLGMLVLFSGVNRLILGLAVRSIDEKGSKLFLIVSVLMILLGIVIITQSFLNLLGLFIIVYAVSEIFGYIYYTTQNKDYSEVLNKKIPQEIKEKEATEAIIEEE